MGCELAEMCVKHETHLPFWPGLEEGKWSKIQRTKNRIDTDVVSIS